MSLINVSICLSDIPKDKIVNHKNGKKYLNMVVAEKRETDQYGKTHTVYAQQTKEEREAKAEKQYLGNGELKEFNSGVQQAASNQVDKPFEAKSEHDDSLPF